MEENLLLKQPQDPRLKIGDLPDLPPGTEMDDYDTKKNDKGTTSKKSTRRSSPSPKRKSPSHSRSRRSPSPARRNRYRYSPERRGSRFDRRRSPPPRDRYRGRGGRRGHSSSRSRSRSVSPANRRSGRSRWSPKKKPKTPTPPPMQISMPGIDANKMMMTSAPPPPTGQFGVMQAPPPPQIYGAEAYAGYGQSYPPFGQQTNAYAGNYNASYGAQNNWTGHDAYPQQNWMPNAVPNANQMPQTQPPDASSFSNNNVNNQTHAVPSGTSEPSAHDAAVAQEAENQRDELKKQRSSYIQKNSVLKKELKMLKDQRKDLDSGIAPPSPTTKGFIDENEKLQSQIIKKIATIDNVIEMLTGVIGEEHVEQTNVASSEGLIQKPVHGLNTAEVSKLDPRIAKKTQQKRTTSTSSNSSDGSHTSDSSSSSTSESSSSTENDENDAKQKANNKTGNGGQINVNKKQEDDDDDSSPERLKHKVMESMKSKQRTLSATALKDFPSLAEKMKNVVEPEQVRFNYAFYDPEMHWCQKCDVFPKTAKDYLKHLHSKEHMEKENASETPWHANLIEDNFPTFENVQTKRMPIRGITFFAPATAWYCKLCSVWMGDLHCASVHLKSRQHSSKYTAFLERNPNFEMNWLADRQRVLNEKSFEAAASQITAVSTTAAEDREIKKSKKNDEKSSKKHKKNADKKNKKKKKKQKKRKKAQDSSSDSSNSDTSSSEDADERHAKKKKKIQKQLSPIKDLDNPNPAASIRLAMRKAESTKIDTEEEEQPPPPPPISMTINSTNAKRPLGNWTLAQEGTGKPSSQVPAKADDKSKSDDTIMQQWNSVQPVISDNEKKLLEQLKGKLKTPKTTSSSGKDAKDVKDNDKFEGSKNRESRLERSYRGKRSRTRSPTRSRSRGRDWRRARSRSLRRRSRSRGRRSRSRSRGRYSPIRGGRRRFSRSRSRRRRSRSRSRNRRGRRSRTRSRSGSRSGRGSPSAALTSASRIEKPVIPHSEFRPRVPDKDKEKEKKLNESKDKKESKKPSKPASTAAASGKKLPFIGKMPVFKKQATGQSELDATEAASTTTPTDPTAAAAAAPGVFAAQTPTATAPPRPPAPTAEQIKMAMMEDVYGNAPPFHPDVGVMHPGMDYEDLMPDPVQFVNLMSQAPPAPPPLIEDANDEADVLPPGIDENEMETEEFVAKPVPEGAGGDALPKDFEEALNIIFPGERKSDDENSQAAREPAGETQIIVEQPVMQMDELFKEGIHMVSIEETSLIAIDEASQLSMNEPLVFNNAANKAAKEDPAENNAAKLTSDKPAIVGDSNGADKENVLAAISNIEAKVAVVDDHIEKKEENGKIIRPSTPTGPDCIPMPPLETDSQKEDCPAADLNLDDIPHPPAPLSESEKQRRQEELDDLAMLGIDADDMAAQCM